MALQEAEYGLTETAFEHGQRGRYIGDETLLVKFFYRPYLNQSKSVEEGRPIFEELPFIQIMQPGNKDSVIIRKASKMDKERFSEHWRKFQARENQEAVEGTLITEWPGVTRSMAEELKFFNILTVEQLAAVSDQNAQNVRGIQSLKKKAEDYLETAKTEAVSEALAAANARIDELMARLEEVTVEAEDDEVEEE